MLQRQRGFAEQFAAPAVQRADIDDELAGALLLRSGAAVPDEFVTRFQQTSPAVTAKGVGDTAFYRYLRLLAFAAAPQQTSRGLFPGYTDRGNISAGVWASVTVELMVVAIAVLAIRYGRDES